MLAIHRTTLAMILTVTLMVVSVAASPIPVLDPALCEQRRSPGTGGSLDDCQTI
ncbi:hypothetical protein BKA62DRAFT_773088 [Auriculariales sp. MPI-PUGE-AT-0066]|nr:hypothetical protein BKA62DRAFT_773088 [Auriculariales sp. MPI-PUGE-AT-0066]